MLLAGDTGCDFSRCQGVRLDEAKREAFVSEMIDMLSMVETSDHAEVSLSYFLDH